MYIKDKNALITGISKGIGKALALQLLDAGANVTGWGLTEPDFKHANLRFFHCDVSEEEMVEGAWKESFGDGRTLDFLVNNAGFGYFSPVDKFDVEQFKRMFEVNVQGMFLVTRLVVPRLKGQRSGHIVNISSIAGRVGMPWGGGYNASKFAVTGFSESMFNELRKEGIKVTTVYPGSTRTHFFDEIPGTDAHDHMVDPVELASSLVHLMNTSPNYCVREIEIRPLNSKPAV